MKANVVFISYAHKDISKSNRICEILQQYHVDYWKDDKGIAPAAEDFNELIEEAIEKCRYFICVWTLGIKDSRYCKKEIELAFSWLERSPDNREIYILKMEEALDPLTDFPPGCRIIANGRNFLYAFDDTLLKDSIGRIASQIEKTTERNRTN